LIAEPVSTARGPSAFPLSKLRGVPPDLRRALKRRGIATCTRLLEAAGSRDGRRGLAAALGVEPEVLDRVVCRADLARISGVGAVFGIMLEENGIRHVRALRAQEPRRLHERLRRYNAAERLARRAPTPEEVADWIEQARALDDRLDD
jgi:predicted flap endonuclease-1-like 5' DNA nuclease